MFIFDATIHKKIFKMGLIQNIIDKKMQSFSENLQRREYLKAFWQFYCAVNLSESYLKIKEEENKEITRIRNSLWRRWCNYEGKENPKILKRFQKLINRDMKVVMTATHKLQKEKDDAEIEEGQGIFKQGDIGITGFEFPA